MTGQTFRRKYGSGHSYTLDGTAAAVLHQETG